MAKGLSMYVVAKRARMSHSMISRVEHELCRPTLDTLLRIADGIEIDLWPLIKKAEQSFKTEAVNSEEFPNRVCAEKPQH